MRPFQCLKLGSRPKRNHHIFRVGKQFWVSLIGFKQIAVRQSDSRTMNRKWWLKSSKRSKIKLLRAQWQSTNPKIVKTEFTGRPPQWLGQSPASFISEAKSSWNHSERFMGLGWTNFSDTFFISLFSFIHVFIIWLFIFIIVRCILLWSVIFRLIQLRHLSPKSKPSFARCFSDPPRLQTEIGWPLPADTPLRWLDQSVQRNKKPVASLQLVCIEVLVKLSLWRVSLNKTWQPLLNHAFVEYLYSRWFTARRLNHIVELLVPCSNLPSCNCSTVSWWLCFSCTVVQT